MSSIPSATSPGQDITKMIPYSLQWEDREISILLPKDTKYSRGMIEYKVENGTGRRQDLVSASSGIPVSKNGSIPISMTTVTQEKQRKETHTYSTSSMAIVSLAILSEDLTAGAYLDGLSKKVSVLSQKPNALVYSTTSSFPPTTTLHKVFIVNRVIIKVSMSLMPFSKLSNDCREVQVLNKITAA